MGYKIRDQACNQGPKNGKAKKSQKKDLYMENHKGVKEAFKILYEIERAHHAENNPTSKI